MPDTNIQTEQLSEAISAIEKAKPEWRDVLKKLADVKPEIIDPKKFEHTPGTKLFRGTSVCDILYAILEKEGELISPLSYPDNDMTNDLGTIMTGMTGEAINAANNQLIVPHLLENKYEWMAKTTGLTADEVKKIAGLWQPIVVELTNNIPDLYVEDHYGEIWSREPINILKGAISDKSMEDVFSLTGINIKAMQKQTESYQSDRRIDNLIRLSLLKHNRMIDDGAQDEPFIDESHIEEYWKEVEKSQLEEQYKEMKEIGD